MAKHEKLLVFKPKLLVDGHMKEYFVDEIHVWDCKLIDKEVNANFGKNPLHDVTNFLDDVIIELPPYPWPFEADTCDNCKHMYKVSKIRDVLSCVSTHQAPAE